MKKTLFKTPWVTVYLSIILFSYVMYMGKDLISGDGDVFKLLLIVGVFFINAIIGIVSTIRNYKKIYLIVVIYHFLSFLLIMSGVLG
jgi:hypothetical protein